MVIGLLKEREGENRVSFLPEIAAQLIRMKAEVWFETGAGLNSFHADNEYIKIGAFLRPRPEILAQTDVLLSIQPVSSDDISKMKEGAIALGVYQPLFNFKLLQEWAAKNITVFSLDMLPRTTRAQAMDVLSSQASIAGYKAVILSASIFPKYFPMLMTSAGSIAPAKVLVLGAGVAGLQAIATAKRLGAIVEVFDSRAASKEEVMSLGAKFIEVEGAADASKAGGYAIEQTEEYKLKQQQRINEAIVNADVVITTAQIPGRRAPLLITAEMVNKMKSGSVIIDLASATGGNCELTRNNEIVFHDGIRIIGNSNLPSTMPADASKLYGKNVFNFLKLILNEEGALHIDFEDDLIRGACIAHLGKIVNEKVQELALHNK